MADTNPNVDQWKRPLSIITTGITIALLLLIAILLVCNLGATGYLVYQGQQTSGGGSASTDVPLPAELSSQQARTALFEEFRLLFNDRDNEGLYSLFDPVAREEYPREQLDQELLILYQLAGEIDSGTYSHYEYGGASRGRTWHALHYRIQTEHGVGTLTITVAQQGQEPYGIWGFNINID